MSIARRSRGTCGHGMWTLGSQVVRLADNGVRVIVPGSSARGRRVARWPGRARRRRPPRRRRVRALQQLRQLLRSREISRRVSRPPYHQSNAGKSACGDDMRATVYGRTVDTNYYYHAARSLIKTADLNINYENINITAAWLCG